ncbi:MAG TPA: asparaginase [Candidatus Limnocylindrales bacterium]|nr:asparaginase [Candidatus Limnocylindrales bacterium]
MPARTAATDGERDRGGAAKPRKQAPPVLVRQVRNGVEESVHRGDIVEVDASGRMLRAIGEPEHVVFLRSAVKPFGIAALIEAGGVREFELEPAEIAVMAASHSGEDLHVRTLQAMFRRTGVSQAGLALSTEGVPIDALTAARLARDGERPGEIRHMCSGYHASFLLLSRLHGWSPDGYWLEEHPAQQAARDAVARAFGTTPARLVSGIDACGVPTYAFRLREVARAYAFLADPEAIGAGDGRAAIAGPIRQVRDAMVAHPEMVGGSRDRLDTSVAKALPGRIAAKGGAEGLRCFAILPGPRARGADYAATGLALKVEDGGASDRATSAAAVEALAQAGVLDGQALRVLGRYHRPIGSDPHGREAAEAIASFELAPVGELVG